MMEKSSNGDMDVFAFDLDSDAILLGYPRYAEHSERLHRHHWKVKNSSLPIRVFFSRWLKDCFIVLSKFWLTFGKLRPFRLLNRVSLLTHVYPHSNISWVLVWAIVFYFQVKDSGVPMTTVIIYSKF